MMDVSNVFANTEFKAQQRRGGRGVQGMSVHDDDYVENMISCSTRFTPLLCEYRESLPSKRYEIPEYNRTAKGLPVINLLNIDSAERKFKRLSVFLNQMNQNVTCSSQHYVNG